MLDRNVVGSIVIVVLAPLFASGFFFASKRRIILSYGLVALIVCFILIVKQLPSPWHEIVDCGVAFGKQRGMTHTSISALTVRLKDCRLARSAFLLFTSRLFGRRNSPSAESER